MAMQLDLPVRPACEGMGRKEVTSLLNRTLIRTRLERRNAYSYWAHEVEVHDYAKGGTVWVDFLQFEPDWHHTATHAGCVERGTFTAYEVKSCLSDVKSGHGMNFIGDLNYVVTTAETHEAILRAWNGGDEKVMDAFCDISLQSVGFLIYGKRRNGSLGFYEIEPMTYGRCRAKPAAELLLCMMRALTSPSTARTWTTGWISPSRSTGR